MNKILFYFARHQYVFYHLLLNTKNEDKKVKEQNDYAKRFYQVELYRQTKTTGKLHLKLYCDYAGEV